MAPSRQLVFHYLGHPLSSNKHSRRRFQACGMKQVISKHIWKKSLEQLGIILNSCLEWRMYSMKRIYKKSWKHKPLEFRMQKGRPWKRRSHLKSYIVQRSSFPATRCRAEMDFQQNFISPSGRILGRSYQKFYARAFGQANSYHNILMAFWCFLLRRGIP